jgi:hypothetical protein
MKKIILGLTLLLVMALAGFTALPAQAQQVENLDTILARLAAQSFLTTLTRPDLASVMKFYALDSVKTDELMTALQSNPVASFDITAGIWDGASYQVKATLQPGSRPITMLVGKYDGRFRIEKVELTPVAVPAAATTAATTGQTLTPVSGNGSGKLVFQTQSGGDIYLINADGTGLRRITSGIDPQLSPDSTKIAFTRWQPRYELFTINVDGSGERALTQGWREIKSPTWTKDGAKLVFSYQFGGQLNPEFRRINLERTIMQGNKIEIPSNARNIEEKNGIISFEIPADAHWYLKQIDPTTAQIADMYTERHAYGPSAHPTQANLVIYRGDNGLALHTLDANTEQPLTNDFRDHTPVISPDGSKIAVSYWQDGHWEVYTLNADGSNRQRLTETPLDVIAGQTILTTQVVDGKLRFVPGENPHWNSAAPVWSPDGSQIAFVTDRAGQWEIWIMNADGSNQRPMFPNSALTGLTLNYAGVDERMMSWR